MRSWRQSDCPLRMKLTTIEERTADLREGSILSFSLERWTHVWRSRHHIMSRVANDNAVLFACSPFYIRDAIRGSRNADQEISGVSKITDNLFTYIPPRWLPTNYRYPALDRIIKEWRCLHIRSHMRRLGMKQPILYIFHQIRREHV